MFNMFDDTTIILKVLRGGIEWGSEGEARGLF